MKTVACFGFVFAMILTVSGCAPALGTSPQGLEIPIERVAIRFSAEIKAGGYKVVTTDELKKWLEDGKKLTVISNLAASEEREYGHIPTAVNVTMPANENELAPEDRERLLYAAGNDKDMPVVVYCGIVADRRSHIAATLLVEKGYRNVYRYPAGIVGWIESGRSAAK